MKKLVISMALLLSLGVIGHFTSDHYRNELYTAAINFEAGNAKLEHRVLDLDAYPVSYLEGPKAENQETIIMLHGFSANKYNWLRFAKHLSDQYHVIALDLMGHGDTPIDLDKSYRIVDQVNFVHQFAKALDIERFHLVGNSMGGAITSLYALTHPTELYSATLISPAGVHDVPSEMDRLIEQEGTNPLIASNLDEFSDVLDFVLEEKPFIPAPVAKVEAEKSIKRYELNQKIFADLMQDKKMDLDKRLGEISVPVLFIWGDQDRAIDVGNLDRYASLIPESKALVYEGIGHMAMIEAPRRSAEDMLQFISAI